uniref:Expressed protein n=1 Tax=Echinococcus granulosus TaxID=6210 RepID=A0A068X0T0_ECHGR|nr:expressed protein [Echinococcus granulosus]
MALAVPLFAILPCNQSVYKTRFVNHAPSQDSHQLFIYSLCLYFSPLHPCQDLRFLLNKVCILNAHQEFILLSFIGSA